MNSTTSRPRAASGAPSRSTHGTLNATSGRSLPFRWMPDLIADIEASARLRGLTVEQLAAEERREETCDPVPRFFPRTDP